MFRERARNAFFGHIEHLFRIDPRYFPEVSGTTDSEVMFFLALTFGLESEPVEAVQRMAGFVEEVSRKNGIADPIWMTLGFSDGQKLYAVRYATDGDAPTLYHSRAMEDLYQLNPALRERSRRAGRGAGAPQARAHPALVRPGLRPL